MACARHVCAGLLAFALLVPWASGCELVADFDRSRIPEPADGVALPDGSLLPPDASQPGPGVEPPAEDAGPLVPLVPIAGSPALDAGSDAALPLSDAGLDAG
jgi:hypothetical protein